MAITMYNVHVDWRRSLIAERLQRIDFENS